MTGHALQDRILYATCPVILILALQIIKEKQMATIGTVHLRAADIDRLSAFYTDVIGLKTLRREDATVYLGAGEAELLALTAAPDAKRAPNSTGLYHFALLVPSRYDLARSLRRLADTHTPLQGMSDHLVSEAIYLADPEDNGIEIYRDRPREDWYRDGEFQLGTVAMDVRGVMSELNGQSPEWTGMADGTIMGHIHLHVRAIPETETFYRDVLAMDIMMNIQSATFMSYEGYHHHVGANIWAGRTPPPPGALGLDKYQLNVPNAETLDKILAQVDRADVAITEHNGGYLVHDPSHNAVVLGVG